MEIKSAIKQNLQYQKKYKKKTYTKPLLFHLIEKFMKDMHQMMNGILDLQRRGQLPDHEKATCVQLLLKITIRKIFNQKHQDQAQTWYSIMEGSRKRGNRYV